MRIATAIILISATCLAETRYIVQINEDGTETIPPRSIATPAQVQQAQIAAAGTLAAATNLQARVNALEEQCSRLGTNIVVTSTAYIRSIGGVAYNPDLQTIRITDLELDGDDIRITGIVTQTPLTPPVLDWRASLVDGGWTNISATVAEVDLPVSLPDPPAKMTWKKAYQFTLPRPAGTSGAFFRVIDNSSGASGSGLYWLVFGGVMVNGIPGLTTTATTDDHTTLKFIGGVLVEDEPL